MVPQALVPVTFVAQAIDHVTVILVEPVTKEENCWVKLVTTLTVVGEMLSDTVVELLPQPRAPSASARASIGQNFQRLIPILPTYFKMSS
jgi:hypothetical protein